jgi:hypothetical protein
LHKTTVSRGLIERPKNIYEKCENSVVIGGKKSEFPNIERG